METEKALLIVKQACEVYKGTLAEHQQIQMAIMTIEETINKPQVPDENPVDDGAIDESPAKDKNTPKQTPPAKK